MKVKQLSWEEVFNRIAAYNFAKGLRVYGVPKGGMILAGFLKNVELVTDPSNADLIVDDIRDSGKTEEHYKKLFPNTPVLSFFHKSDFPGQWVVFPWESAHPAGFETVEQNIIRILEYIGEDVHRDGLRGGLRDTPKRVIKSYGELFSGYHKDPKDLFTVFEEPNCDTMVVLKDIEFYSMCEHHMLPFHGKAHVAYIPADKKIVGISKLARLVDLYARRLQVQERIGNQVTDALMQYLKPLGAACVIEASHMCMRMRGVGKQNSSMTTSSLTGIFAQDPAVKAEFMNLIK